jgi:hypothetical protein
MPISVVTLVDLPKSLRKGIERRLPRGGRFNDLSGRKYGHWLVVGFAGFRGRFSAWLCQCKCGKFSVIEGAQLGRSRRQSCGCIGRLSSTARSIQSILNSIKSRCYRRSDPNFYRYGALGITVCKRWLDSAEAFVDDMGPRPSKEHTLMRRDLAENFTPENCFWGTKQDARRSQKRVGIRQISSIGKTLNLSQWAEELGISREAMRQRLNKCLELGLDVSAAVTTPVGRHLSKNPLARKRKHVVFNT